MKILVLTNMYPKQSKPWFGIFVKEQVYDLRKLGHEVKVLSFDGTDKRRNYLRAALSVRAVAKAQNLDLIHAHYGLTGAVALSQRRLPVVTTFHGSDYTGQLWQRAVSRIVARRSTPIVVSEEGLMRLGVTASVIPAGVDASVFKPLDRVAARKRLGWDTDRNYALLPGARSDPLKQAPLFDLVIAMARQAVPNLSTVTLEGFRRQQVVDVMNAVNVTVMTSSHEGSPVAVKESLACMTPVVSVSVGDVPMVLAGLRGCAVVPREPGVIAAAVVAALQARRAREWRGRALEFARPQIAEKLVQVYERVLSEIS